MNNLHQIAEVKIQKVKTVEVSDENGFWERKLFPTKLMSSPDPFVLFEEFFIEAPGRFPYLSYKGFEVITLVLDGSIQHRDSLGNKKTVEEGDVQRLTAGKGIQQYVNASRNGVNHGVLLWINLPEEKKQMTPGYQKIEAKNLPHEDMKNGYIRKVAGNKSPLTLQSNIAFKDILLDSESVITLKVEENHNGFIYVLSGFNGEIRINDTLLHPGEALFFEDTARLIVHSKKMAAHFLFITGLPLNQSVKLKGTTVE